MLYNHDFEYRTGLFSDKAEKILSVVLTIYQGCNQAFDGAVIRRLPSNEIVIRHHEVTLDHDHYPNTGWSDPNGAFKGKCWIGTKIRSLVQIKTGKKDSFMPDNRTEINIHSGQIDFDVKISDLYFLSRWLRNKNDIYPDDFKTNIVGHECDPLTTEFNAIKQRELLKIKNEYLKKIADIENKRSLFFKRCESQIKSLKSKYKADIAKFNSTCNSIKAA